MSTTVWMRTGGAFAVTAGVVYGAVRGGQE